MRKSLGEVPAESAGKRFDRFDSAAIERMSRTDACPECVVNVEQPRIVSPTADGHRAHYQCTDCGHTWFTSWRD